MQHRSIFQHNTVLLASIIVQLAESTVYSLHWHLSDIQNNYSVQKLHDTWWQIFTCWRIYSCNHNQITANLQVFGPALGSKVKCHYIIEHNVSLIQLPLKHNSYVSRNRPVELRNSIGVTSHPVAPLLPRKVCRQWQNRQVGGLKRAGG